MRAPFTRWEPRSGPEMRSVILRSNTEPVKYHVIQAWDKKCVVMIVCPMRSWKQKIFNRKSDKICISSQYELRSDKMKRTLEACRTDSWPAPDPCRHMIFECSQSTFPAGTGGGAVGWGDRSVQSCQQTLIDKSVTWNTTDCVLLSFDWWRSWIFLKPCSF